MALYSNFLIDSDNVYTATDIIAFAYGKNILLFFLEIF